MIDLQRNYSSASADVRIKIVGLGGAGSNALDRLMLDGIPGAELVAMNADSQALTSSVAMEKVQLGRVTTRGLGAGGDPEIGYAAAEESLDDIRTALDGARMVFICVGLGGGTGSGAARLVGLVARQQGALVISFATMPFAFEGRRRTAQAEEALAALQSVSDVVICFDNDKMGDAVSPRAGIQEAFAAADQTISQSVRAVAALANQKGIIHIGFDELASALRGAGRGASRCLFGFGEAEGDNRAHEALARALKSPLMEKGRMLEDAHSVLVNVSGGSNMTLNEVQILMDEFGRHVSDQTQILFGTSVEPRLGQKMNVTIISSIPTGVVAATEAPRPVTRRESSPVAPREPERVAEPELLREEPPAIVPAPEPTAAQTMAPVTPDAELIPNGHSAAASAQARAAAAAAKKAAREAKQEQMQFEPVTRGRFEKSEPTIVDGQDLDVPTFLRRNMKVK
ncbi:MAG: cell division protein FtsZ [Chthoniobacter sp.]|jgi:cell division protein FtsZ|nr:cell division protein FtsZ [Chthoniobacter sp.]